MTPLITVLFILLPSIFHQTPGCRHLFFPNQCLSTICVTELLCVFCHMTIFYLFRGETTTKSFVNWGDGEKDARTKAYDPPRASPCHSKTSAPLSCYYASSCKSHNKPVSAPNPPAISTFPPGTPRPDYFLCLLF